MIWPYKGDYVSLNISEFFDKTIESDWLSSALKSLKLEELSEFEKKLNFKTCEGVTLLPSYLDHDQTCHLNSFPKSRKLVRFCTHVNSDDVNEGINLIYGSKDIKHPQYIRIVDEPIKLSSNEIIDILGLFISTGRNLDKTKEYLSKNKQHQIIIRSSRIHNAGGSIVQELSFILSCLKFIEVEQLTSKPIIIEMSVDSLYFNNIAKLRALRFLAESLQEQCGLGEFEIITSTSKREQTLYDPWMNMLRNTASTAAAFLGGADQIGISSYDSIAEEFSDYQSSDIGIRQSRNSFHVLNEESFLSNVEDSGAGSYVLESLTKEYVELAFEKFKLLEGNEGVLCELTKFSHEVEAISYERQNRVSTVKASIAGVNNFANTEEKLSSLYDESSLSMDQRDEELFPIRRNSKNIEKLRQCLEEKDIEIKILAYGPENKLSARLMFCANYFEILGKKCEILFVDKDQDLTEINGDGFILCSTEDLYSEWLSDKKFESSTPHFIAGKKFTVEGIQNIYMGQNVFEILQNSFGGEI
jgi:hypothetical protein